MNIRGHARPNSSDVKLNNYIVSSTVYYIYMALDTPRRNHAETF